MASKRSVSDSAISLTACSCRLSCWTISALDSAAAMGHERWRPDRIDRAWVVQECLARAKPHLTPFDFR